MKWAALVLVISACGSTKPSNEPSPAEVERARATIRSFKQSLIGELTDAMSHGIPAAIEVCHTKAPQIATTLSRDGVVVGRATRKARNPANRAAGWQLDALAHFEAARDRGEPLAKAQFTRVLADGRVGYAEPLVIAEVCTACHGKQLAPEVATALAARYPADEATGYAVGDLRGVAWVELAR